MRHSLLSRFHGVLCGSLLAETLANNPAKLTLTSETLSPWTKISFKLRERLINGEQLPQIDWEAEKLPMSSSTLALATLPLAVYYHDYSSQGQEQFEQSKIRGTEFEQVIKDVLIWEYAIALALREKLNPNQFIMQLMEHCSTGQTTIKQQLGQIQTFLTQGTPLNQVVSQLSCPLTAHEAQKEARSHSTAMALAFYCFAATPEDFSLSVLRARQTGYQTSVTTALTGALAGAYNSFNGIPLPWRWAIGTQPIAQSLYQQVSHLFALWTGVYVAKESEICRGNPPLVAPVASPLVIQPRSALKIISQKKYL